MLSKLTLTAYFYGPAIIYWQVQYDIMAENCIPQSVFLQTIALQRQPLSHSCSPVPSRDQIALRVNCSTLKHTLSSISYVRILHLYELCVHKLNHLHCTVEIMHSSWQKLHSVIFERKRMLHNAQFVIIWCAASIMLILFMYKLTTDRVWKGIIAVFEQLFVSLGFGFKDITEGKEEGSPAANHIALIFMKVVRSQLTARECFTILCGSLYHNSKF